MVENNYQIATRYFSYDVLRSQLSAIIKAFFGDPAIVLTAKPNHTKSEGYLCIDPQLVMYKHYDSKNCRIPA
jgi:hypothetical protein